MWRKDIESEKLLVLSMYGAMRLATDPPLLPVIFLVNM